jgi:serine/threonine protein kinase
MLEMASTLRHPNVADIHEAYYHENKFYIISEYLDVSLLDLNFNEYPLEEWEIATIIVEVKAPVNDKHIY